MKTPNKVSDFREYQQDEKALLKDRKMHLGGNNINDDYFSNILTNIKKYVPEFETVFDNQDIYPITFEFGNYLLVNFTNEGLLEKAAYFINEAVQVGAGDTKDLIVLQIFQLFYDHKKESDHLRSKLSESAKSLYDKSYRDYKMR